ncbi:MAG TPA: mannitol dehydrogenase family protein [Acidimicrobiales bacterium]|nr:mannitol dehydrogenase family protein [Acidimicrobiales bacterium]
MRLETATLPHLGATVATPGYDRRQVRVGIAHIGVGGFHRSHQAMYVDRLMEMGEALDWGICGIGLMPADLAMHRALSAQDGLYTLMTKDSAGRASARVVGSIVCHLYAPEDPEAVLAVLSDPMTRVVSLTVTEGGYNIDATTGKFDANNPAIRAEAVPGAAPSSMFGYLAEALRRRRRSGAGPFTVMSCDNVQSNGATTRDCLLAFAALHDPGLADWIEAEVAFPNSMVDRITPVTAQADIDRLRDELGVEDLWPVVCEPFTQWVLEDNFVAGRPPLERAGVQLTRDVEPYELMKLRLLNAGHQAIAYHGRLAGYTYAHEAATDPVFVEFLVGYMNCEARPTLEAVPDVDLDEYVRTLVSRFGNPYILDTIARLCAFSSDRVPKWVLPVVRSNLASGGGVERAVAIVASWARYCEGIDEDGRPIEVEDHLRDELMARAAEQSHDPLAFVRDDKLFGGLADDPHFAKAYVAALGSLHQLGARRSLEALNAALA